MKWPFEISIDPSQEKQLLSYAEELRRVNRQFNLISRQDENRILSHHVGHCLAFGLRSFRGNTSIVDWGSGGGLPAIPIAILYPEVSMTAVDSNSKKTRSVDMFCRRLNVLNCSSWHGRAEAYGESANCSVSRATAPLTDLWKWHTRMAASPRGVEESESGELVWPDGLICLKGGDLTEEKRHLEQHHPGVHVDEIRLRDHTDDAYFSTKSMVVVTNLDGHSPWATDSPKDDSPVRHAKS